MTANASSGDDPLVVVVGRVVKPHGVRGELVVELRTDSPEERFATGSVLGVEHPRGSVDALTVSGSRTHSGRLLVRFEEVTGRAEAEALRGARLTVRAAELPETGDPEEFYDHQLVGLVVLLSAAPDGENLGTVNDVVHTPGGDLLAVSTRQGGAGDGGEVLVPFVREIVPEVDLAAGRVLVDPPEGLFE